jgi:uncharacterized membrane protein YjjP (DUF1212 family)
MKKLFGYVVIPFKLVSSTKFSSFIVNVFNKSPWLLGVVTFLVTLLIMFIRYGI